MKGKFCVSVALFLLPTVSNVQLFASDEGLAKVLDVGTIEFEVGERRGISGEKQPRLFVTKPASLDSQLMRIVGEFVAVLSSAVKDNEGDEELHGIFGSVLSNYWRSKDAQIPARSVGPNFIAALHSGLSGLRFTSVVNAVLYASGAKGETRIPGLVRGIEFAIERRFLEFAEQGKLEELEKEKIPFFIVTLLLSRFKGDGNIGSDDTSEKLLFFGRFEEIVWNGDRPDKVKVRVSVLPSGINSLELLLRTKGSFDEKSDGLLLDMLHSAMSLLFEPLKTRQMMRPVIAVPVMQKPELAQLAVAAALLGEIKLFSRPSEGIAKKVAALLAGMSAERAAKFRRLLRVDPQASKEERTSQMEDFISELIPAPGEELPSPEEEATEEEPDGIAIIKLLEGGPIPGLFTPISEYWKALFK